MSLIVVTICRLTLTQNHFALKWLKIGRDLVILCAQDHENGEVAEAGVDGYKSFPENEANNLKDATPVKEGMTKYWHHTNQGLGNANYRN